MVKPHTTASAHWLCIGQLMDQPTDIAYSKVKKVVTEESTPSTAKAYNTVVYVNN